MCPEHGNYRCHDNLKSDVSPYTEKLIARMSQQMRLPYYSIAIKSRMPPICPHVIMPLVQFKRNLGQRSAKIIATHLHYTLFTIETDNIR